MSRSENAGLLVLGAAAVGFVYFGGTQIPMPREVAPAARHEGVRPAPAPWHRPERDPFFTREESGSASWSVLKEGGSVRPPRPPAESLLATPPASRTALISAAVPASPAREFPPLRLTASFLGRTTRVALVNGSPVGEGEEVQGARLIQVLREEAVFKMGDLVKRIPIADRGSTLPPLLLAKVVKK